MKIKNNKSYTLMELIVVICLIGFIFALSLPKFRVFKSEEGITGIESWIRINTKELKLRKIRYSMNFDMYSNTAWIEREEKIRTDFFDDTEENKKESLIQLPKNIRFSEIEISRDNSNIGSNYKIYFYENGYSDKARIKVSNEDGRSKVFMIEPFLTNVIIKNEE